MRLSQTRATETRRHGALLTLLLILLVSAPAVVPAGAAESRGDGAATQQPQPQPQPGPPAATDEFVPISQLPAQDQLPAAPLLVTAYAFVWLALFGYLLSVGRRLGKVQREVDRLESDIAKGTRT
jgi:CcmD family protein